MEIKSLQLFSKDVKSLKDFYLNTLGMNPILERDDTFTLNLKNTRLIFREKAEATPYHFAINIPSNQEIEALNWLKERVEIQKFGDDEIIDFSAWNAKSMYFYDTDQNIVELIARKNLPNDSDQPFGPESFLEISEIGAYTKDIAEQFHFLNQNFQLDIYDGGMKSFCAIGDDRGLFIVIDKSKNTWFPVGDQAYPSRFDIELKKENATFKLAYNGSKFIKQF